MRPPIWCWLNHHIFFEYLDIFIYIAIYLAWVVPQFGIAKLVNITPISLWFIGDISILFLSLSRYLPWLGHGWSLDQVKLLNLGASLLCWIRPACALSTTLAPRGREAAGPDDWWIGWIRKHEKAGGCVMIYDGLWWFMMIYDDLWWFMMIYDDFWWFMMIYDDLWWFKYFKSMILNGGYQDHDLIFMNYDYLSI